MDILREEHPVARKKHICDICGCPIEPGTRYYHQVNIYDGFCDLKAHEECVEYYNERDDDSYNEELADPSCWLSDDLEDILGKKAADEFTEKHSVFERIKFVLEHEKSKRERI